MGISFVYFDMGGVAILDMSKTDKFEEFKREIGITPALDKDFEEMWEAFEHECCLGRSVDDLKTILKDRYQIELPTNYSVLKDGFVNRFTYNFSIWPVIEKIHKRRPVGLLTNAYFGMFDAIKAAGIIKDIKWDVVVDSSVVHAAKPEQKIFKIAQKKAGVPGNEILFAENSTRHIDAAKDFGWQTFLYDPANPKKSSNELLEVFNLSL